MIWIGKRYRSNVTYKIGVFREEEKGEERKGALRGVTLLLLLAVGGAEHT